MPGIPAQWNDVYDRLPKVKNKKRRSAIEYRETPRFPGELLTLRI
jgi:hypothetical protein